MLHLLEPTAPRHVWRRGVADLEGLVYHALRPDPSFRVETTSKDETKQQRGTLRIRCPLCAWQPDESSRWVCAACPRPEGLVRGCGTMWHSFSTRGRCPGCAHQWRWTSCLACEGWSLHEAWYAQDAPEPTGG